MSEPVQIKWKKGKDLTGGLLDLVCKAWDVEGNGEAIKGMSAEQKTLKKKIENTGMGGLSFFAWFGYIGRKVSKEESDDAKMREAERRTLRKSGQGVQESMENEDDDEDEAEDISMSLEIFPDGDELAIAITEDLWPGAMRYFSKSYTFLPNNGIDTNQTTFSASTRARRPFRRRF